MKRKIVVKMGGSTLDAQDVLEQFAEAVAIVPGDCDVVVVHGGGKDIGRQLAKMGREFKFIEGLLFKQSSRMENNYTFIE